MTEIRDGFKFRGGHPALDLTATLAARRGTARELLATTVDLRRWLTAAGLPCARVTTADLRDFRRFREALYRLVRATVTSRGLPAADRTVINGFAALAPSSPRLGPRGPIARPETARSALAALARAAVALFAPPVRARLRGCEGPTCSLVFLDTSRPGRRRWCSMAACGNRAKVSEFRRRAAP
jgi:predicted RNA-binding Zn ribbon-like protein